MKFNKNQLQIISYCLANLESDCENADTRQEMHHILGSLQNEGIWGHCDFYNECSMCEDSMWLEEFEFCDICPDCRDSE
jgi:hypothetical protein